MKLTPQMMKKIENFAKPYYLKNDPGHRLEHMYRTVRIARYLAKKEGADVKICEATAFLHDIVQTSYHSMHEKKGAKISKEFLKRLKIDEEDIVKICNAIERHNWNNLIKVKNPSIEDKISYDADKLQMLIPSGLSKGFAYRFVVKKLSVEESAKEIEDMQKRVFRRLQTKTAKKLAEKYYKPIIEFWRLYREFDRVVR